MDIKIWGRFVGHWYHKSWGVLCSSECVYQMYIVYLLLVCLHSHGISSRRWTKWNFFWAENTFRIRVRSKEKCQANIFLIKSFAWEWESDELNWEWRRRFFFLSHRPPAPSASVPGLQPCRCWLVIHCTLHIPSLALACHVHSIRDYLANLSNCFLTFIPSWLFCSARLDAYLPMPLQCYCWPTPERKKRTINSTSSRHWRALHSREISAESPWLLHNMAIGQHASARV